MPCFATVYDYYCLRVALKLYVTIPQLFTLYHSLLILAVQWFVQNTDDDYIIFWKPKALYIGSGIGAGEFAV
jgi:hypothetical protein